MSAPATPPQAPPRTGVLREFVPGIALFRSYQRGWLPKDVVAGLVLTALLVPQGMAYAELAGLPADHRPLHVDPVPARLRAVRPVAHPRPRPRLVARPDDRRDDPPAASRADGDPAEAIALASMLALLVGVAA